MTYSANHPGKQSHNLMNFFVEPRLNFWCLADILANNLWLKALLVHFGDMEHNLTTNKI